jgi:hypothetical protein
MFPDNCDNFLIKWGTFFKRRIIALGKQDYPAVRELIEKYKDNGKLTDHALYNATL